MRKPVLTIFYQFDPCNPSIGGIQSCIRSNIKYLPDTLDLQFVGIGTNCDLARGRWHSVALDGRSFSFLPLFHMASDDVRGRIPTTLRYTGSLLKYQIKSDFYEFHRIEPSMAAMRWPGRKLLYIHNDIYQEVKGQGVEGGILWRKFPTAYFALEKQLVKQFSYILSCNTASSEFYRQRYPTTASRITYRPNTVDGDRFYPLPLDERDRRRRHLAQTMRLPEHTLFLLFAGRLHPQKDPLLLIRAIAQLKHPAAHLLIVGEGELKPVLQDAIRQAGLADRVSLLGSLKQHKLADLYRVCSLYVLSSAYEGLPMGSIESLACGTPVVTTPVGETPRFLDADAGVVTPDRTPRAIAHGLDQVLSQPRRYSVQACTRVARQFDAKAVVHQIYAPLIDDWNSQHARGEPMATML